MEQRILDHDLDGIYDQIEDGWDFNDPSAFDDLEAAFAKFPPAVIPLLSMGVQSDIESWMGPEILLSATFLPNYAEVLLWMRENGWVIPSGIYGDLILHHMHTDPNSLIVEILFGNDSNGYRWWQGDNYECVDLPYLMERLLESEDNQDFATAEEISHILDLFIINAETDSELQSVNDFLDANPGYELRERTTTIDM